MSFRLACRTFLAAVLLGGLGACQWRDGFVVLGDTDIHPPPATQVDWVEVSHRVAFAPGRAELSPAEADGIATFLARADVDYGDRVVLTAKPGAPMADRRVEAVRSYLQKFQVPAAIARQPEKVMGQDEVELAVSRYRAVAVDCPDWDRAVSGGGMNGPREDYGCVTAAARAAHAVDPTDLLGGDALGDASGAFTALGVRRYRAGIAGRDAPGRAETFRTGSN